MAVGVLVLEVLMVNVIIIMLILERNHPYARDLKEGDSVKAGDVIGYLGMTSLYFKGEC